MKTLKIGIAGYDRMKARTVAIARGEHEPEEPELAQTPHEPSMRDGGQDRHCATPVSISVISALPSRGRSSDRLTLTSIQPSMTSFSSRRQPSNVWPDAHPPGSSGTSP